MRRKRIREPLIVARGGIFYASFWNAERKQMERESLGIPIDIPVPESPGDERDWWSKSKHSKHIAEYLSQFEFAEIRKAAGVPVVDRGLHLPSLETLLKELIKYRERKRGRDLSPRTIEHWNDSIKFLRRYKAGLELWEIDEQFIERFRKWALKQLQPSSLKPRWTDYRAMFDYAVSRHHIETNPFAEFTIHAPKKPVKLIDREIEEELFEFLYLKNRPLFDQNWGQRMEGFRVTENANLMGSNVNFKQRMFQYIKKGGGEELYPIMDAALVNLETMRVEKDRYLYRFRNRKTISYYTNRAFAFLGRENMRSHDFKRAFAQEIKPFCKSSYILELAVHHEPTQAKIAVEHYIGREQEVIREAGNEAQKQWVKNYDEYRKLKDDGKVYSFSNPKSHGKRRTK